MTLAIDSSTFSFVSLVKAISLNSSKVYSGISKTANLDKRGSIIFSMELAVANIDKITDCESYLYNTFLDYLCKIVVTIMVIVEVYWKRVLKIPTTIVL